MEQRTPSLKFINTVTRMSHVWTGYLLYFLFRFAHFLLEVPTVRMIEYAACHQQLDHVQSSAFRMPTDTDEAACKTPAVQEQVARIVGWKMSFDSVPGLLSAIYFGSIADRYGHRMVLTLCCVGYLLALLWILMTCFFYATFPVSVMLISSFFLFLGGGSLVFAAITVALVAHLVPTSSRTRYLLVLAAMPHFAKLISPPIATVLMARNVYLPSLVSAMVVMCCIIISRAVKNLDHVHTTKPTEPDRSGESLLHHHEDGASSDHRSSSEGSTALTPTPDAAPSYQVFTTPIYILISRTLHQCQITLTQVCRSPLLAFGSVSFFLKSNAMASETFVFQYISEKFHWALKDTTILRFALSFGAVLTTLLLWPVATAMLVRRGVATTTINLGIIHISLLVLVACFTTAWYSDSDKIFILSMLGAGFCEGLEPALQGLLSASVRTEEMGRLFALLYTCSLLGDMTGGPLMSALMSVGRGENSAPDGYCFLASAILFAVMSVLVCTFRPSQREGIIDVENRDRGSVDT